MLMYGLDPFDFLSPQNKQLQAELDQKVGSAVCVCVCVCVCCVVFVFAHVWC